MGLLGAHIVGDALAVLLEPHEVAAHLEIK